MAEDDNTFHIGEFDEGMMVSLIPDLVSEIKAQSRLRDGEITLYISSPGGDGYMLKHIIELVEIAKRDGVVVRTVVPAMAYSAGSMLAVAGTPGERYIGKDAEHMVHYGYMQTGEATPTQTQRVGAWKNTGWKLVEAHYNKYCDIPDLSEHLKDDLFFVPARKCIKWKLADKYMNRLEL